MNSARQDKREQIKKEQLNKPESFVLRWGEAEDYIGQGKIINALDIFMELAQEGYSEAYVEIGNIFERGVQDNVPQDLNAARHWYMKAIDATGDPFGYIGLARLALGGYADAGTVRDGLDYLSIAANTDNPIALTILGTQYHSGQFVSKNIHKAIELYQRASAHGFVLPLVYLAKANWEQGYYWSSIYLRIRAFWEAYRIAKNDRHDPRLWNYLS